MTPLMRQYWGIKKDHLDKVLLFRMGDFFEMFHDDAITAAPIINIALTQRNKKGGDDTKMCGVPHHSIAGPIAKLLSAGHKVAICDQVEDPAVAKGIVKRAVTRILTPGMVYDPETLDQVTANYICAYSDQVISFFDSSTLEAIEFEISDAGEREQILRLLNPSEILVSLKQKVEREKSFPAQYLFTVFEKDGTPSQNLKSYLESLASGTLNFEWPVFKKRNFKKGLYLSSKVISHLEIFENYKGEKKGSLYNAINRTRTSSGARLLKDWMRFPLSDLKSIQDRQYQVSRWKSDAPRLKRLRELLVGMGDLERRIGRICSSVCSARDLVSLAEILDTGFQINQIAENHGDFSSLSELSQKISKTFRSELPLSVKDGGMIEKGVHPTLDEWIDLTENSQKMVMDLEVREKEQIGVSSLKVRFNNVFGYYIELTKLHAHKAPSHYMRKQTLANAERFTTDELNQLEEKVLSAKSKRSQLEFEIFENLKSEVLGLSQDLIQAARTWAEIDVFSSLAWLALERNYVKPTFSDAHQLHLELSRHPALEQEVKGFTPNTVHLKRGQVMLITGPNMAGKSTVMRQVALLVVMAQMGSFVPCSQATLPLFRKIFSRIGASDDLAEGLSTFMVEMTEAAEILNSYDEHSLIIMDEIGRGTSTFDGMSLAQAIVEHIANPTHHQGGGYCLFSTHYHELTRLQVSHPQVLNFHMSAEDRSGVLSFLHTLKPGPANKSYGIQVARLAGLPKTVTQRAEGLLKGFEDPASQPQMDLFSQSVSSSPVPSTNINPASHDIIEEMKKMSLGQMTPIEVLTKVDQWQKNLT